MEWGFLGEFWNAVAGKTLEAWQYTTEWFQQIGLAVAGAIGGLFDYLIHYISDFFVFLSWMFSAVKELTLAITLPISYIGSFLRGFIINAVKEPTSPDASVSFATSTMEIFATIPYWSTLSSIVGIAILVLGGIAILRLIIKL